MTKIKIFFLAVKFWMQGDNWENARIVAEWIIYGFKRMEDKE